MRDQRDEELLTAEVGQALPQAFGTGRASVLALRDVLTGEL